MHEQPCKNQFGIFLLSNGLTTFLGSIALFFCLELPFLPSVALSKAVYCKTYSKTMTKIRLQLVKD